MKISSGRPGWRGVASSALAASAMVAGAVEWVTAAERGGRPRNNGNAFALGLAHLVEMENILELKRAGLDSFFVIELASIFL